jgi:AraC family transcriptional regulator
MGSKQPINPEVIQSIWGVQAKAAGAGRLGVSAALWNGRPKAISYEISRPACELTHVVSIWTKGQVSSELHLDGRVRYAKVRRRGTFQMARAGESVRAILSKSSGECLDIYLPVTFMTGCLESEFERFKPALELLPLRLQEDLMVASAGDVIAAELKSPDGASRIAIDSASLSLAVTLIRRYSNVKGQVAQSTSGLAEWQKRRAIHRLRDAVDENISLSELASEVGLSPYHFARAFKKSVGMAPHQYQIHLRMQLAQSLLASSPLMIGEIAQKVGYNDLSYFTRLFRRRFGVTPRAYRNDRAL